MKKKKHSGTTLSFIKTNINTISSSFTDDAQTPEEKSSNEWQKKL